MQVLPDYLHRFDDRVRNFSLYFEKFSTWEYDKRGNLKSDITNQINNAAGILKRAESFLAACHSRQRAVLRSIHRQGGFYLELRAKLVSPYVSGLGGCHPTETGFVLDRNTGLPYIPASGIKGVLRLAHALELAEKDRDKVSTTKEGELEIPDREESMRKYFGDTDTKQKDAVRGQLVFLDAFPATIPTMRKDIMDPHFGGYYRGEHGPVETGDPIPVYFMTVAEGVEFIFRLFALPLAEGAAVSREFGDDDRMVVVAMFERACTELGFGAKTSIGYGRFDKPLDTTDNLVAEWKRIEEEEASFRKPWLREISKIQAAANWGDFRQKVLENPVLSDHRGVKEVVDAVMAKATELRNGWRTEQLSERDSIIAAWLEPAGVSWPSTTASSLKSSVSDAGEEIERIKAMKKWADYLAAPAHLDLLSRNGLKQLKEKLKGWGCDDKNAKEEKRVVWEKVNRRLKG